MRNAFPSCICPPSFTSVSWRPELAYLVEALVGPGNHTAPILAVKVLGQALALQPWLGFAAN